MSVQGFQTTPVWIPNENCGGRIKRFQKIIEEKYNQKFGDYFDFHRWSVENLPAFWAEFWNFTGIICSKTYDQVIDLSVPMEDSPKWYEGAKLNYAENLLKYRDDHVAMIIAGEDRDIENVTYAQLYEEAKLYAAAFRKIGLQKGDRVACYISNRKEAVIGMIAVTSIGAIWTGALPLLGSQTYLNRVKQVSPKYLLAVDQFPHNMETKSLLKNIEEIAKKLPSLEKVIVVPSKPESKLKDISNIPNSCFLDDFLQEGRNVDGTVPEMVFEQVSFSHPVFISYTSGTTGLPKTLVHGCGAMFPGIRDFGIHLNGRREEVWLSSFTVGWIGWNMVNNLLVFGETIALFEGVPYFLSPTYLWDLVDNIKVTRILTTTNVLDEMENRGFLPTPKHHLTSLSLIACAGSVIKPHNYNFVFQKLKKDLMFAAAYGSTEVMGICMVSEQTLPVYRGEIPPSLGVAIECLDETGRHVLGQMGECIIAAPMPTLPLGIWRDTDGEQMRTTYFSKYRGKFSIGDTIIINPVTKGIIICGRSDETLKQRGYRIGSSEIYNIVELFNEIESSLCVSQYSKDRNERAVLFIKMQDGHNFTQDLVRRIRQKISKELSENFVPDVILESPDIPRNVNGKKMEIIVKKIINNMPYKADMVANAECLHFFNNIPELQGF